MELNDYTLEEFREMEHFGKDSEFNSLIIVPTENIHDSGFRCMKFILLDNNKIVGVVGGNSDVVHPNGIGNYCKLSMDCLTTSGCVRLILKDKYKCDYFILSDFEFRKSGERNE